MNCTVPTVWMRDGTINSDYSQGSLFLSVSALERRCESFWSVVIWIFEEAVVLWLLDEIAFHHTNCRSFTGVSVKIERHISSYTRTMNGESINIKCICMWNCVICCVFPNHFNPKKKIEPHVHRSWSSTIFHRWDVRDLKTIATFEISLSSCASNYYWQSSFYVES